MKFRTRALARAGAAVLLASGATAALSAPAYAAGTETDLELSVVGTKVAANSEGKLAWAKITNKGSNTPRELSITADVSGADFSKLFVAPIDGDCSSEGGAQPTKWTCELTEDRIPGPGETVEVPVITAKVQPGVGAYSAPVTFTISSPDDTNKANNSKQTEVVFSEESGVDLGVEVPDVKEKFDPTSGEEPTTLHAGDTTSVLGWVYNWGDMVANGVRVTVQLPKNVTFAETEPDCTYSSDNRKATCEYKTVVLNPTSEDEDEDFVAAFFWPITVGADVEGPVTLAEGSWTVEALDQSPVGERRARPGALPKNVKMVSAAETGVNEVDASDNVDGFAVVVDGDGGSGGGGGLPVTGVQAGVLGGIGLAVVLAGGVLFLAARRRRVVLVTPGDEKSTS